MIPPGLAYVALSPHAWAAAERNERAPTFYLDLRRYRQANARHDTPWTPAIPLVKAQAVALSMLREEGLEQIWRRTRAHADVVRRGMAGMGLELLSRMPADSVTAVRYPAGVDDGFRNMLASEHGMHVAGGQDELSGRIFRVNHMGWTDVYDALACVAATEQVLRKLGATVKPGTGVSAAQEAISEFLEV
jgi:aspartate aminotransferase-like enzyme